MTKVDVESIVKIAKGVSLKAPPPRNILDIIYSYDEGKTPNVAEVNNLLSFIKEKQSSWQKPRTTNELISEILLKIGSGPRKDSWKPMTKDELITIHAWVMSQK
jgi:hypothetical protein